MTWLSMIASFFGLDDGASLNRRLEGVQCRQPENGELVDSGDAELQSIRERITPWLELTQNGFISMNEALGHAERILSNPVNSAEMK